MSVNIQSLYRADIDGLRAVAVLSVIGFHAFPKWIPGGFVGVDIFFVISGFLISAIIFQGVSRGTFSFTDFYARRIKRIFPALLLVLITCLTFSAYSAFTPELIQIARHVAAGAGFVSNIVLSREFGYFDTSSELKPLLHLWSLGVEEQYYIIWPLLVAAFYTRPQRLLLIVWICLLGSFAYGVYRVEHQPIVAFFLPTTRFWELMVGSLLAYVYLVHGGLIEWLTQLRPISVRAGARLQDSLAIGGMTLILYSMIWITRDDPFPGLWALPPTIGALFIIAAGPRAWLNRSVLTSRLCAFFGLISYPLYLWHWPLLSFLKINRGGELTGTVTLTAICAAVLLAWLTFRFIERPIRFSSSRTFPTTALLCLLMALVGARGWFISVTATAPSARDEYVSYFEDVPPHYRYAVTHNLMALYRSECDFYDLYHNVARTQIAPSCYTPRHNADIKVLIWGDSHTRHLSYGLTGTLPDDVSVLQISTSGCRPTLERLSYDPFNACNRSNTFAAEKIAELKPDLVILGQSFAHERTDWGELASAIHRLGARQVLLLGPLPQWNQPLHRIMAEYYWPDLPYRISRNLMDEVLQTDFVMTQKYTTSTQLIYLSLIRSLCNDQGCLARLGPDIREDLITPDFGHLSPRGARYVVTSVVAPTARELIHR